MLYNWGCFQWGLSSSLQLSLLKGNQNFLVDFQVYMEINIFFYMTVVSIFQTSKTEYLFLTFSVKTLGQFASAALSFIYNFHDNKIFRGYQKQKRTKTSP